MNQQLKVSIGQHSAAGRKDINQDFHGALVPREPQLTAKGVALGLADGVSSSAVSQEAAQAAVTALLDDYYCTSDAWSVKTSVEHVLVAINSWLHAQTQQSQHRYERERGYVCTFSGVVIKSTTAHLFHVGDARIYRLRGGKLEQLTEDHRVRISSQETYLARALGMDRKVEIDYLALPLEVGDLLVLATDGVYEHTDASFVAAAITACDDRLDEAARAICDEAYQRGSGDNLTLQIVRIDGLPSPESNEMYRQLSALPFPPRLEARMRFEGYEIVREIRISSRSHIYLAVDGETGQRVVIKTPSVDQRDSPAYLERFLMEEWIAKRINSPHVLKPCSQTRQRHYIYVVSEYIEGQTLAQWMIDNPKPDLASVRGLVEQIAKGLQAFHRLEMVHQDLKPDNIMIDGTGTVKIIDFGATRVAGVMEIATPIEQINLLGSAAYAAPEYFLGENGSARSDIYSLGVIAYQMLSGKLPYGVEAAKTRTRAAQKKLAYQSVLNEERDIPAWVDAAIRKAVEPDPLARYEELSEFVFDLHHPNQDFLNKTRPPLIERHPVIFWKSVSFMLMLALVVVSAARFG
ncbi:MAG: bifunctional protein-serine/threonine kinase/phosphatase [Gammaproteobacteria bacterium]|nr:bifunctional protein-serine/threonine kinase/phosphatase [Gammaproteobacteria bacterium]MBU1603510.1 bifunctional protein-serine/threonine kinase/phosphatase [Gammaproteobacteria bacterium]MBU2433030.1 bifunctional protein-serine/threonine kinase/phosphatase [Gammaproteobacteria bacterium]MBU2450273.1 bifunctional protein-serine/threonine kinase/phosphatase [Gammaproteobacteria bacterium]